METIRFLEKAEYQKTYPLFVTCFTEHGGNPLTAEDREFLEEYYGSGGAVYGNRIAVLEDENGEILSMVHVKPVEAVYKADAKSVNTDGTEEIHYIMGVATRPDCRHRGYMDRVMEFVLRKLTEEGDPWCFLIAVDKAIYRHLGFDTDWPLGNKELEMLYADEGLTEASARLLNAGSMRIPAAIRLPEAEQTAAE